MHYSRLSVAGNRNLIWTCLGKNMKVKLKISWVTHVIHKVHELPNFKEDQRYTQILRKTLQPQIKMPILFQRKTLITVSLCGWGFLFSVNCIEVKFMYRKYALFSIQFYDLWQTILLYKHHYKWVYIYIYTYTYIFIYRMILWPSKIPLYSQIPLVN